MAKPTPEYVSINKLAERLGVSRFTAQCMAKSQYLRSVKGAVINVNTKASGKYEILRINIHDAIGVHTAYYSGWK